MIQFEDVTDLFTVNFEELRSHLRYLEDNLPKAGGTMFNGWTVTSKGGSYKEAWVDGSAFFKRLPTGKVVFDPAAAKAAGFHPKEQHVNPTDASSPELMSIISQAKKLGLAPCRARLIQLVPGASSSWHTDGTPENLILRLHVVIQTNPGATFASASGLRHLEQDRIFLINVNDYHSVQNSGPTNRTHLVVDVTDTKKISKVHR